MTLEEVFDKIDDGIMDAFSMVNSDPAEYVYIRPASIENVYCRVSNSATEDGQFDLHISWTAPWNGVKPDYYGVWMHQPYKEFTANSTEFVFPNCTPEVEYDLWVRPYQYDRISGDSFKGSYSDKFTCRCNPGSQAIKKLPEVTDGQNQ